MLYHLLPPLADVYGAFNVFVYITFRAAGAVVTSLLIAFALGPIVIRRLAGANVGQVVRESGRRRMTRGVYAMDTLAVWKRAAPRNRMREIFTYGSVGGLVE